MIKINKDYQSIPCSLRTDSNSILRRPAKTTNERRKQIIALGSYPDPKDAALFDSRYKYRDIKTELSSIYYGKCAYCESSAEQLVVEHYRPKRGGYYWLAFSWDNLLLACPQCNNFKSDQFPVEGPRIVYDPRRDTMEFINHVSILYDELEHPVILNPETASQEELNTLVFDRNGQVFSDNLRMRRTIEICMLNRKPLQQRRQKIWDDLEGEIQLAVMKSAGDKEELTIRLNQTINSFLSKNIDRRNEYIAFRRFIIKSRWINRLLYDILGCYM